MLYRLVDIYHKPCPHRMYESSCVYTYIMAIHKHIITVLSGTYAQLRQFTNINNNIIIGTRVVVVHKQIIQRGGTERKARIVFAHWLQNSHTGSTISATACKQQLFHNFCVNLRRTYLDIEHLPQYIASARHIMNPRRPS